MRKQTAFRMTRKAILDYRQARIHYWEDESNTTRQTQCQEALEQVKGALRQLIRPHLSVSGVNPSAQPTSDRLVEVTFMAAALLENYETLTRTDNLELELYLFPNAIAPLETAFLILSSGW